MPGTVLSPYNGSGCTPPNPPSLSASPATINSGGSSTLSASNCSGTISWSNGLGGGSPTVSPTSTTTYTATCTVNGCTSNAASVTVTVNGTQPASYSQCQEAESSSGNGAITSDPSASNGQTRGEENNYNHYVDYVVTGVPSAGTYYARLRYFSSSAPVVSVQINGGGGQAVNLNNSGSWNIGWTEQVIAVSLSAGTNTIGIQGTGGGSCKQDRLCVNSDPNARMSAEEPTSGNGYLAGQPGEGDGAVVTPNPNAGSFELRFYLAKGSRATLSVIDVQGKSWFQQNLKGRGNHQERINLTHQASGTFVVQLRRAHGTDVKKVVVK